MAERPDGSPAGTQKVAFTKQSADRIAKVVRKVEAGDRSGNSWSVSPRLLSEPFRLRLGTFTGNWQTGQYATVTLHGSTQTASVFNWCNPALGGDTCSTTNTRYVIFGKVSGRQSAVEIQMRSTSTECTMTLGSLDLTTVQGYASNKKQALTHDENGCWAWVDIEECD